MNVPSTGLGTELAGLAIQTARNSEDGTCHGQMGELTTGKA